MAVNVYKTGTEETTRTATRFRDSVLFISGAKQGLNNRKSVFVMSNWLYHNTHPQSGTPDCRRIELCSIIDDELNLRTRLSHCLQKMWRKPIAHK